MLKQLFRKLANNPHTEWDNGLPYVLWAYRETTHKIIEFFPYRILFGNEMKILLDQLVRYGKEKRKETRLVCENINTP